MKLKFTILILSMGLVFVLAERSTSETGTPGVSIRPGLDGPTSDSKIDSIADKKKAVKADPARKIMIKNALESSHFKPAQAILESGNLTGEEMRYLLENMAYMGSVRATNEGKMKLTNIIERDEASEVLRFLPVTVHYKFKSIEKIKFMTSLCRFESLNESGFESIKVLINRTQGLKSRILSLDKLCSGAA